MKAIHGSIDEAIDEAAPTISTVLASAACHLVVNSGSAGFRNLRSFKKVKE